MRRNRGSNPPRLVASKAKTRDVFLAIRQAGRLAKSDIPDDAIEGLPKVQGHNENARRRPRGVRRDLHHQVRGRVGAPASHCATLRLGLVGSVLGKHLVGKVLLEAPAEVAL